MTLGTHAVTGALIGAVASHNLAFVIVAAFLSHFVLDAIPHWDYDLISIESKGVKAENDMNVRSFAFIVDLSKIGFDIIIGIILVAALSYNFPLSMKIGACIGAFFAFIPDPLQFVYWKTRFSFMTPLQTFHMWMHSPTHLNRRPLLGIFSQTAIIALTLVLSRFL